MSRRGQPIPPPDSPPPPGGKPTTDPSSTPQPETSPTRFISSSPPPSQPETRPVRGVPSVSPPATTTETTTPPPRRGIPSSQSPPPTTHTTGTTPASGGGEASVERISMRFAPTDFPFDSVVPISYDVLLPPLPGKEAMVAPVKEDVPSEVCAPPVIAPFVPPPPPPTVAVEPTEDGFAKLLDFMAETITVCGDITSGNPPEVVIPKIESFLRAFRCHVDQELDNAGVPTTFLILSTVCKQYSVMEWLLSRGANPNITYKSVGDSTPLHYACLNADTIAVKLLLSRGADPKAKDARNQTPGDVVPKEDDAKALEVYRLLNNIDAPLASVTSDPVEKILLDSCMNPASSLQEMRDILTKNRGFVNRVYEIDDYATTLLYTAARSNNVRAVQLLVEMDANVNMQSTTGSTALHVACYRGFRDIVVEIMKATSPLPNVNLQNAYGEVCTSVFAEDVPLETQMAIKHMVHKCRGQDIHKAIQADNVPSLEALLNDDIRANMDFPFEYAPGKTATMLQSAVVSNALNVVNFLVSNGSNPFCKGPDGWAPFHLALEKRAKGVEMIKMFLGLLGTDEALEEVRKYRLAKKCFEFDSLLPLFELVMEDLNTPGTKLGYLDKFLLLNPFNVQQLHSDPRQPAYCAPLLVYACRAGNLPAIQTLLQRSANITQADSSMNTPLHVASEATPAIVNFLLTYTPSPDLFAKNDKGMTPEAYAKSLPDSPQKAMIVDLLVKARETFETIQEEKKFQAYIDTIRLRTSDIGDLPALTKQVLATTSSSVRATDKAIRGYLFTLFHAGVEEAGKQMKPVNGIHKELLDSAVAHTQGVIRAECDKMDYMGVPDGCLLPTEIRFKKLISDAMLKEMGPHFQKLSITLPDAIQKPFLDLYNRLAAAGDKGVEIICDEALKLVGTECRNLVRSTVSAFGPQVGRLERTCYVEFIIPEIEAEFKKKGSLDPTLTLLSLAHQPKTIELNLSQGRHTAISAFFDSLETAWRTLYPGLVQKMKAVRCPGKQRLTRADGFVHQYITDETEKSFSGWVDTHKLVVDQKLKLLAAIADYVEDTIQYLANKAVADYKATIQPLGPSKTLWDTPTCFKNDKEYQAAACDLSRVEAFFLQKLKKRSDDLDKLATPAHKNSKERLQREVIRLITKLKATGVTGFENLCITHLRPLHLNIAWTHYVTYGEMDNIRTQLNAVDVLLVEADTGSGKTVLLPQFLKEEGLDPEHGYTVVVTEPRREAALSVGSHVRTILGENHVGFKVAGVDNPNPKGLLQYYTDAFYLGRALSMGTLPTTDTCVIIDEAHERNAAMDMLYYTLLHFMQLGRTGKLKIVLASATVNPTWFADTVRSFGLNFGHANLRVPSPFPVHAQPTPRGLLVWPDPKGQAKNHRSDIAAHDAFDIMKKDPKAKIIVFLPHRRELEDAQNTFRMISGGSIESHAIHAQTQNVLGKIKNGRVFFSNNVLETSFTVEGLTHVLDFNLGMTVKVNVELGSKELLIDQCLKTSQVQRRGRVGRTAPGRYVHYYDISKLPDSLPISFDQLPNDTIIQYEIRARHYLHRSLFAGVPGFPVLGTGITARPKHVMDLIPTAPNDLEICAVLSLTGGMGQAFLHALRANTCPLAILWLSAILDSRVPFTHQGQPIPAHFATIGLGVNGDHGVLLECYQAYLEAKRVGGTRFDAKAWAAPYGLQHFFLQNVEERMVDVMKLCERIKLPTATWAPHASWKWSDLEVALLKGYWRNTIKVISSPLGRNDWNGPYRSLDNAQLHSLTVMNGSAWAAAAPAPMPEFILYFSLENISGRLLVKWVCGVTEANLAAASASEGSVEQSIGLTHSMKKEYDDWVKAMHGTASITYPNTTFVTAAPFPPPMVTRWGSGGSPHIKFAFVVKGNRVDVSKAMDAISADIVAAQQYAQFVASAPVGLLGGKVHATLSAIQSINPAIANRLKAATSKRTDADLKSAIASTNALDQHLAIANVLLNVFQCELKGGWVRDVIVFGDVTKVKDYDLEAPGSGPFPFRKGNLAQDLDKTWAQALKTRFGITMAPNCMPHTSFGGVSEGIVVWMMTNPVAAEFEFVSPWNQMYIPPRNIDFSAGNLRLKPNLVEIHQTFGIDMSVQQIIGQLMHSPPLTTPVYDITWGPGGTHGVNGNQKVTGNTPLMAGRVKKYESKGYKFIELSLAPLQGMVTLYHGTGPAAAQAIISTQRFNPSSGGNLGAGVYMSRDLKICRMFVKTGGMILSANVDVGKVCRATGWDSSGNSWRGYDSVYLSAAHSPRSLEEWTIADPKRIKDIQKYC